MNNRNNKTTKIFRVLKKIGLIGEPQRYGKITICGIVELAIATFLRRLLFNYAYKNLIFEPINKKILRPKIWRLLGCKVGKNVMIGHAVRLDFGNARLIEIGDNAVISNNTTILCHKRDISCYFKDSDSGKLPFKYEKVTIGKGCQIGLNCTILPGVSIGEGTIIGSCSLITRDSPAWCIAVGSPAKVVRTLSTHNQVVNNYMGDNRIVAISPCLMGIVA